MRKRTKIGLAAVGIAMAAFVGAYAAALVENSLPGGATGSAPGLPEAIRTAGVPEEIQTGVPDDIETGVPGEIQT